MDVIFSVDLKDIEDLSSLVCAIVITDERARRVISFHTGYHSNLIFNGADSLRLTCHVPQLPLVPGTYMVDLILAHPKQVVERVEQAATFSVVFSDIFETGKLPNINQGYFALPCKWEID